MKVFTFLTVSFLPQQIVGALFGMNVPVPMMDAETILPWCGVTAVSFFFTLLAFGYFRHVKYI